MKHTYNQTPYEVEQEVIKLYKETTLNMAQIGEELKLSPKTIKNILVRNNIPITKRSRRNPKRKRKYNVNDNYFSQIDSHEKAYILGFLYADGYLVIEGTKTKRIGIDLIDKEILVDIGKALSFEGSVTELKRKRSGFGSDKTMYRLIISSEKMYEDLISLGCTPRKSLTLTFPTEEQVSREFVDSFILGYFDGDGSLIESIRKDSVYKSGEYISYAMSFVGTREFLESLLQYLDLTHLTIQKRWKERDNNHYNIRISGNHQVYKILEQLYSKPPMYLQRKFDIFKKLEKYNSRS